MPAKPSTTGVTPQDWSKADRTPGTGVTRTTGSAERQAIGEMASRGRTNDVVRNNTPSSGDMARKSRGTKVQGATSTRGGSL